MSTDYGPSNWGRWGDDDQRGTLNFITPDVVAAALASVRRGAVLTLGCAVGPEGPIFPGREPSTHVLRSFDRRPTGYADDLLVMNSHSSTHLDALSHAFLDGLMYNNRAVAEFASPDGMTRNSVDQVGAVVTRGILLDIAKHRGVGSLDVGDAITSAELDECAEAQGVVPRSGDVCLVRTGWIQHFSKDLRVFERGEPGLALDIAQWFHRHELVALGVDNGAIDVLPAEPGGQAFGLHPRIIQRQGGYLLEFLDLEELSATDVAEFLIVIAPLKIAGGAGSPVNPVVVF